MNESTLTRLKAIVERAVRPVRASFARKRRMREELLAHVMGVFEKEAKLGDEQAALARTLERFGQAADLTDELQASVPPNDRVVRFGENLFGYESGEPALRVAVQAAAVTAAFCAAFLVIAITVQLLRGQGGEWLTVGRLPSLLCPLWFASLAFCGTLLTRAMRPALLGPAGRSWLRASLLAAAAWVLVPLMSFAVCLAVLADVPRSLWEVVPLLPHSVLAPVALVGVTYLFDSEFRHSRDWARLDIN
jgi:hypothetical protein